MLTKVKSSSKLPKIDMFGISEQNTQKFSTYNMFYAPSRRSNIWICMTWNFWNFTTENRAYFCLVILCCFTSVLTLIFCALNQLWNVTKSSRSNFGIEYDEHVV